MRSVCVQFLPSGEGLGCLSAIDLDLEGWDDADDLRGSLCVRPDEAHNAPDNPHVFTLIEAWTAAGVSWLSADDARRLGFRLTAPYQQSPSPA